MDSWWTADGLVVCERITGPRTSSGVVNSVGRLASWIRFEFPETDTWVQVLGGPDRLVVEVGGWPWVMPLRLRRQERNVIPAVMVVGARSWVSRSRSDELVTADEVVDALGVLSRSRAAPAGFTLEAVQEPVLLSGRGVHYRLPRERGGRFRDSSDIWELHIREPFRRLPGC